MTCTIKYSVKSYRQKAFLPVQGSMFLNRLPNGRFVRQLSTLDARELHIQIMISNQTLAVHVVS